MHSTLFFSCTHSPKDKSQWDVLTRGHIKLSDRDAYVQHTISVLNHHCACVTQVCIQLCISSLISIMLCLAGRELTESEHVNGVEMEMKSLSASAYEQSFTDVLQSLSELNMMKPGQTLQVRIYEYR